MKSVKSGTGAFGGASKGVRKNQRSSTVGTSGEGLVSKPSSIVPDRVSVESSDKTLESMCKDLKDSGGNSYQKRFGKEFAREFSPLAKIIDSFSNITADDVRALKCAMDIKLGAVLVLQRMIQARRQEVRQTIPVKIVEKKDPSPIVKHCNSE
jgi:hypothetical protein